MLSRVKYMTGYTEIELSKLSFIEKEKLIYQTDGDGDGNLYIQNKDTNSIYQVGKFEEPTINNLLSILKKTPTNIKCKFHILENVDIGSLQATLKQSDKAMVQVASNFNCLEMPSKHYLYDGYLNENAHTDTTQGPAAVFGPLVAYIYRTHYLKINLLSNVEEYFGKPINGKISLNNDNIKKIISLSDIDITEKIYKKCKIGIQENAEIIFDRNGTIDIEDEHNKSIIDQVFVSSINLADSNLRNIDKTVKNQICKILLKIAYDGTMLSAIYRKRKNLYLTLIGEGSFQNPLNLVLEALVHSLNEYTKYSNLENIYLCLYKSDNKLIFESMKQMKLNYLSMVL